MSRGLGAVQRRVLEQLKLNTADPMDDWDNGFPSWMSAAELAGDSASRSGIESVRRAVIKLDAAGLVETLLVSRRVPSAIPQRDQRVAKVQRYVLVARLPLEGEIRQKWQNEFDHRNERARRMRASLGL
jgi:hypothetical protein